jgi:hypothetical protein
MRELIEGLGRAVMAEGFASPMRIMATKGMLDFVWHPMDAFLEVGLGGEWSSGKLPLRDGQWGDFHHRKEGSDSSYRPVQVIWDRQADGVLFRVRGGFLGKEATILVSPSRVTAE